MISSSPHQALRGLKARNFIFMPRDTKSYQGGGNGNKGVSIPEKDLRIMISRWCHSICKRGQEAPSQILFPPGLVIQEHRVQRQQAISPSPERARGSLCHALLPLGALWLGCFCVHPRESSPGLTQKARKASNLSPLSCLQCLGEPCRVKFKLHLSYRVISCLPT